MIFEFIGGQLAAYGTKKVFDRVLDAFHVIFNNEHAFNFAHEELREKYEEKLAPASYEGVVSNLRLTRDDFVHYFRNRPTGSLLDHLRKQLHKRSESWVYNRPNDDVFTSLIDDFLDAYQRYFLPECQPVTWNSDGLKVYGTINAFSTTLTGGRFNISNVGDVQLRGGQIAADILQIDSTNRTSPITGKVNKFEISLEGQNLHIDGSTLARVARAEIKANDLIYKVGQSLPIGTVYVTGSATGIEGGKVGKVRFDAGAKFELKIDRRDGDEPEIATGTIDGEARVAMDGGNFVRASVSVDKLRYYRGHGDAVIKLTALEGSYTFLTPAAHESKSEAGFEAQIDVKSIKLVPTLAEPIVIGPTNIKASQGAWSIDPVIGIPYKLQIPIGEQELVYAPIKSPVGGTLCAPKVNLAAQTPFITGKIDVFAADSGGKIKIYNNALSAGIVASADDRGCGKIAALVCFLVGSAFGGPIGGAGLAMLCVQDINQAKAELSNKIRDESVRKVAESKFDFSY